MENVLDRAARRDTGASHRSLSAQDAVAPLARKAMRALAQCELRVPRAATFDHIVARTCLLEDYATHKVLTGDPEAAARMARGEAGLLQLFERGTQDRKELEALVCAALRERGRLLLFTSAEVLVDRELVESLGEADRTEVTRRADAYLILEEGAITFDAYHAAQAAARRALFKQAARLGLVVGVSIKSDLGLRNRRTTSGELHLDRCPIVLFAMPRINAHTGAMSDIVVYAGAPTGAGRICYVGGAPHNKLTSIAEVRCAGPRARARRARRAARARVLTPRDGRGAHRRARAGCASRSQQGQHGVD